MEAQAEKKIFLDGEVKELIQEVSESAEESEEISVFPIARVKKIMQLAYKENLRSDTVHLLSKATELFLKEFVTKSYQFTKSKNKKTIMMNEVIEAVATHENLGFLKDSGILTEKSSQEEN